MPYASLARSLIAAALVLTSLNLPPPNVMAEESLGKYWRELPWQPHAIVDDDPVCAAFVQRQEDAFRSNDIARMPSGVSVVPWKGIYGSQIPELFLENQTGQLIFHQYVITDVDNDGDYDILLWRDYWPNYITSEEQFFYFEDFSSLPSDLSDIHARDVASIDANFANFLPRRIDTPAGQVWFEPHTSYEEASLSVLASGDLTLILQSGTSNDAPAIAVSLFQGIDSPRLVCVVLTDIGADNPLYIDKLPEVAGLLSTLESTDSRGCHSRNLGSWPLQRYEDVLRLASSRPWLLDSDMVDSEFRETTVHLVQWAEGSVSTWRSLKALNVAASEAEDALAGHYTAQFHIDPNLAERWARRTVEAVINAAFSWDSALSLPDDIERVPLDMANAMSMAMEPVLSRSVLPTTGFSDPIDADSRLDLRINALLLRGDPEGELPGLLALTPPLRTGDEPVLHYAVGHPDSIRLLLDHGVSVDATNTFGKTALMYAAQYADTRSVQILLDAGAEANRVTIRLQSCPYLINTARTALDYALQSGSQEVIDLLREHGALTAEELGQMEQQP